MWATLNTQRQSWDRSVWSTTRCLHCTAGVKSLNVFSILILSQSPGIYCVGLLCEKPIRVLGWRGKCRATSEFMSNVTRCVARALWQVLPAFYCQDVLSVTSSKIPPGARSLCNYRCKLGVCGKLPDFLPPLPVNNTLPTTFHYLSWVCDLMPVSRGVKRVDVLMKVTVLPKLFRVQYIINLKMRTMSCCGMCRR